MSTNPIAKKVVRAIVQAKHYEHMQASSLRPDKASQRKLAEQALSEWKNQRPVKRVSNLTEVLRRKY